MALLPDDAIVMHPGPMNRGHGDRRRGRRRAPLDDRRTGRATACACAWPSCTCCSAEAARRSDRPGSLLRGARAATARTPRRPPDPRTAVIAAIGARPGRRPAPRSSTPAGWSLLPGLVDLHTHLREPGREDAETVETGSPRRRARRVHRGARDGQHRPGRRHRRRRRAGLAARARRPGWSTSRPVGAVTVGLRGERLAELGAMADSAARVRVFSDDGTCVHDPALMRRALEYVKAFDGVVAQHAEEPRLTAGAQMHEGDRSRPARAGRLAGRGRGGDRSPATCCWPAHVGRGCTSATSRPPGSVEILRWAKSRGRPGHRRGHPAPPAAHRRAAAQATTRSSRSTRRCGPAADVAGAARRRWPTARSTPSPPTTRRTRWRTRRREWAAAAPGMLGLETALSVVVQTMVETGLLDWRGVADRMSVAPAAIGRLAAHGRPLAVGEPANLAAASTRPHRGRRRPGRVGQPQPQHPVRGPGAARPGGRDVPARRSRPCWTGRRSGDRSNARPGGRADVPRRARTARSGRRSARRCSRPG